MYFRDRTQAGELLAARLMNYRYENCAVLALSPGGVLVGEAIARRLHTTLSMLLTSRISAPGDTSLVLGTIDQDGDFMYNDLISTGQMEEYMTDFRNYLEEEKMHRLYDMTKIVSEHGFADARLLAGRHVILATDGVKNGLSFEAAYNFLRPIHTLKVIAAVPVGQIDAMERLNERCDEVQYLYIPDTFMSVGHYYEEPPPKSSTELIGRIDRVVAHWI
jgi:putative phosphoribosyl transferase